MVSDWYHGISDDVVLSSCISWHRASLINTNVHHQYRFLGRNRSLGRGLRPSVTDLLPVLLSVVIPVGYGRFGALHVHRVLMKCRSYCCQAINSQVQASVHRVAAVAPVESLLRRINCNSIIYIASVSNKN